MNPKTVISILGSSGGVAKALLSIFNKVIQDQSDPIQPIMKNSKIHLIDLKQKDELYYRQYFPVLMGQASLHQFDANKTSVLKKHLKQTKTTLVIDVSWADTVEVLKCCDELGILYINTALENTSVDENEDIERFTLLERYRIFEENKGGFVNTSAIIGSGMNPGVVQWMALEIMKKLPDMKPKACYIVERDNSFFVDKTLADKDTIYTTWSPECFLDEAILNFPMFIKQHTPLLMYKEVYELEFKVTLGPNQFYGCLMPHEEVLTLGKLYDMEIGFIYRVNDHTTELIRNNIENTDIFWTSPNKVLDPAEAFLEGEDLVGVLVVYEDQEAYMYNVLSNQDIYSQFGVNATYFQVACGIYAGVASLLLDSIPKGAFYVDEMLLNTNSNYGQYLLYYMKDFIAGTNTGTDGLLLDRMKAMD
ncbi:S-adenosylmethionine decarboxylase related protein [Pseudobacteroides cellulosolvens]|uniref:Saccharopine dehydrogenase n=1 Tax=Pseudobacteroides cellulosolvens ATCC 35603 = DSM 2933 TaxID=398512 RepID=A0A0L6JXI9_9FIRM|nr:S-adenosylmethionine decarboxylase related protein [Pseudobacteroides cellulosolvens]KNY30280.1 Saccharopine dehydrogenase [Pseudobacteroides cellulosolvens ATCC 35603 = DSM 2933]